MTVTEPEPMSRTAVISYAIGLPLAVVALVFLPVGRLNWPPGWFFIIFLIVVYGASALILARVNSAIYRARSRLQPGTERWDRLLLLLMLPAMIAEIPLATLDAGRMSWSAVPLSIVILGYVPAPPSPLGPRRSTASLSRACASSASAVSTSSIPDPTHSSATQVISVRS